MGGVRIPFLISNRIKVRGLRRGAVETTLYNFGSAEIGFSGVEGLHKEKGAFIVGTNGKVLFSGKVCLGSGTIVRVDSGNLKFGNHFSCNNNCFISCTQSITIGDEVLMGWNVNIRDSDGHTMFHDGKKVPSLKPVIIGDHIWIAACVDILKGSIIPDGSVVAYRSCITKPINEKNSLIAGYPAKVVRSNIEWKK